MNCGIAQKCLAEWSSLAAQYETLRMAVLGEPLPPEARSGLVVFLRRGMWGWARALASASVPVQPSCAPSSNSTALHPRKALIQAFASMALNTNHGRAQ